MTKQNYEAKRSKKTVSFNQEKEIERRLLEFSKTFDFSQWAKEKLLEKMESDQKRISVKLEDL